MAQTTENRTCDIFGIGGKPSFARSRVPHLRQLMTCTLLRHCKNICGGMEEQMVLKRETRIYRATPLGSEL